MNNFCHKESVQAKSNNELFRQSSWKSLKSKNIFDYRVELILFHCDYCDFELYTQSDCKCFKENAKTKSKMFYIYAQSSL